MENENLTCNHEEVNEFFKAYWTQQKQDEATTLLEGSEEKESNSKQQSLIHFVEEAKAKSSKNRDTATKKLPSSPRGNLKHFKKPSNKSSEYFRGRQGSPLTACRFPSSPKRRHHSSDSSSDGSPRFHYPKHFDLRSILPKKSAIQQNADCYKNKRSYKSLVHESSSSLEMDDTYQVSKSKWKTQRSSSNNCRRHSYCCRKYDSFSSSDNESYYHPSNHRSRHSRHRLHRRRSSRSPYRYPDHSKSTKPCHKSKRSSSYRPIEMVNGSHSSKSEPPGHLFDHYNGASHSGRGCDLKRESNSAQIYDYHHKGNKRCRSPSFEQWSWSFAEDDVHEKHFEEDILRPNTCSAEKRKIPGKEIWKSPTLERESSNRYSGKKDAQRVTFLSKASKDNLGKMIGFQDKAKGKLQKTKCPVDENLNYNRRMCEEILKTIKMRKKIEKWIMSNDEVNPSASSPRVLSRENSVAIENDPASQTEFQDVASQESRISIEKDHARQTESQIVTSKENKVSVKNDPIGETGNPELALKNRTVSVEKEECRESEAAQVAFVKKSTSVENGACRESESRGEAFIKGSISVEKETESLEVIFVERSSAVEQGACRESVSPETVFVERSILVEKEKAEQTEVPEVTFVERSTAVEKRECGEAVSSEVDFVKSSVEKEKSRESETAGVIFVKKCIPVENDKCMESKSQEYTPKDRDSVIDIAPQDQVAFRNDYQDRKKVMPSTFFCSVCQINVGSEVTLSTHLVGKRHTRKMQLQTVYEIAKGSLQVKKNPHVISHEAPRFANSSPCKKRRFAGEIARLQSTIDGIRREPVAGLEYVHEIRSSCGVCYNCTLCLVRCKVTDILPHLTGFRHQLGVVRKLFPGYYRNQDQSDKVLRNEIRSMLLKYEEKYGRGSIKVFREDNDPDMRPAYNQPGPSYRYPTLPYSIQEQQEIDPTNLYFSNLPSFLTENQLEGMLRPYGNVVSTRINRYAGLSSRVSGFARMDTPDMCERIIKKINGKVLPGDTEPLLVKFADLYNKKNKQFKSQPKELFTDKAKVYLYSWRKDLHSD